MWCLQSLCSLEQSSVLMKLIFSAIEDEVALIARASFLVYVVLKKNSAVDRNQDILLNIRDVICIRHLAYRTSFNRQILHNFKCYIHFRA